MESKYLPRSELEEIIADIDDILEAAGGIISTIPNPALALIGDVNEAKWIQCLGAYKLTFASDHSNTATTGTEYSYGGRTYRGKVYFSPEGNIYAAGDVSALSFTDRTPGFAGDALVALRGIKNTDKGQLDHATLPDFARKKLMINATDADGKTMQKEEDGRDLGAMISILTCAVQQLAEKVEALEKAASV